MKYALTINEHIYRSYDSFLKELGYEIAIMVNNPIYGADIADIIEKCINNNIGYSYPVVTNEVSSVYKISHPKGFHVATIHKFVF